jgi:hypothetical protein
VTVKPRSVVYAERFALTYAQPNEPIEAFSLAQWRDLNDQDANRPVAPGTRE